MPRVFVSHSCREKELADRFVTWLRGNGFDEFFLGFDKYAGFSPGEDWEKQLYWEIERATVIVLLLSKNWLESKWCFAECTQARALGKTVIPVVVGLESEKFPWEQLQKINLLGEDSPGNWRQDWEDYLGGLLLPRLHTLSLEAGNAFAFDKSRPPYPGMMSFAVEDAAVYFGREPEVRQTVELMERLRVRGGGWIGLLHGESGSGKSSLMKAGLLPQLCLRKQDWVVLPSFRPGTLPTAELRSVLLSALEGYGGDKIEALLQSPSPETAEPVLAALQRQAGKFLATVLFAIDQAEELISLPAPEEQARFLAVLAALLGEGRKSLAVATLRTSDLPSVAARLDEGWILHEEYLVGPFRLTALPQIVRRPARVAGIRVCDELVEAISRDATSSDILPLVAFLLRRLYDDHGKSDRMLTLKDYEALGDPAKKLRPLEACVRDTADQALERSHASGVELVSLREVFVDGLAKPEGDSYVRRTLPAKEILPDAARLCQELVAVRLLIRREDGSLEVAHEALFRVWPLLAQWLSEDRDFLLGRIRIDEAMRDWEKQEEGDRDKALLTGVLLKRAEEWLKKHPGRLREARQKFIEESVRARDEQAARAEAAAIATRMHDYHEAISGAAKKLKQGRIEEAVALLDAAPRDLRQLDWAYLRSRCDEMRSLREPLWQSVLAAFTGAFLVSAAGYLGIKMEAAAALRNLSYEIPGHFLRGPSEAPLSGEWITRSSHTVDLCLVIVAGMVAGAAFTRMRPGRGLVAGVLAIAVLVMAGTVGLHAWHRWNSWSVVAFVQIPLAYVWGVVTGYYRMKRLVGRLGREQAMLHEVISKYLSPQMLRRLIEFGFEVEPVGESAQVAIMFTDLECFTDICERLGDPRRIVTVLNQYLERTTKHVVWNDGVVIKYLGDSIFAAWGVPNFSKTKAVDCLRAAWELSQGARLVVDGIEMRTRVGLHFGDVVAGNVGGEDRLDYTLVGDAVNFCARLEGMNKILGTQLLVSAELREVAEDGFRFRRVGRFRIKGRRGVAEIYELLGPLSQEREPEWLALYHSALEALERGDSEEARNGFEAVCAARDGGDGPSRFFLSELACNEILDGVVSLREK